MYSMSESRTKTAAGEANVERILSAALGIFSRYGYRGSRTEQIADAAGMSKPNLLYYFKTKEELYEAVLRRGLTSWVDAMFSMRSDADVPTAIGDYIAAKLHSACEDPESSRLFAVEVIQGAPVLAPAMQDLIRPALANGENTLRRWAAEGRIADLDPTTLIFMLWAITQHYADFASQIELVSGRSIADPQVFETIRETITHTILYGILPRPPADAPPGG
jgi:TetR/AcrR family transcriptional regulator